MSERYPGGFITKNTPVTTQTSASGVWTLDQAMQATKAGNWPVNGPFYIEEVFSTYLYTGTGATQTINNGIDLAGKGGLVWLKERTASGGSQNHQLSDTVRGAANRIFSNLTNAQDSASSISSFNSSGFSLSSSSGANNSGSTYVSWTFREQPKFFDVVAYTGDGTTPRNIPHNLGSVPGCVIVKMLTDSGYSWQVYHRGLTSAAYRVELDTTGAETTSLNPWVSTAPTASVFTVSDSLFVNGSGKQYVAYLFAHNAGGFGLTGTDNVISCGSFTTDGGGGATVNLGYEPQWILYKESSNTGENWSIADTMRGMPVTGNVLELFPNNASSESTAGISVRPNATGFTFGPGWSASRTFIYIAIRRGPMKVPTTGTSVFKPQVITANGVVNAGFPSSATLTAVEANLRPFTSRLTNGYTVNTNNANAQGTTSWYNYNIAQNSYDYTFGTGGSSRATMYDFQRAPGFFDQVCYTGDGVNGRTVSHNLTVAPELIMVKNQSASADWAVYANGPVGCLILNATNAANGIANFPVGTPTATTFAVASSSGVNGSGNALVAYLFATCPGVSKVGTFTGTGATQVINCGFTGGARFVLIKSTSTTGNWYVWDSARGIVAGNDPYLELNTVNAEVTGTDWVDTASSGFELSNSGGNLANSNGVSYIFLAIA